ncbi:MAG: DinB family protein [Ignavibacteria bacterium]|nr:DinB family protein [Ignavibacteria bacterium]
MAARMIFTVLLTALPVLQAIAQDGKADMTGFRAEFNGMFSHEAEKVLQLLDAMPDEKFSWRPSEGVRSVGETYMHIAVTNVFLPSLISGEMVDVEGLMKKEKEVTSKADVREYLEKSFKNVKKTVASMTDADLEKSVTIEFIPLTTTARGVMMLIYGHLSEHLGQSIAYARMNNVVPPWTAAQQEKQKEEGNY